MDLMMTTRVIRKEKGLFCNSKQEKRKYIFFMMAIDRRPI